MRSAQRCSIAAALAGAMLFAAPLYGGQGGQGGQGAQGGPADYADYVADAVADPVAGARVAVDVPIVILQLRDHLVVLQAGREGLRYAVALHNGTLLADDLDEAQLRERHPAIHRVVQAAYAAEAFGDDGSFIWAGNDLRVSADPIEP